MQTPFIQAAISKATREDERSLLAVVLSHAMSLDTLEQEFERRINQSKALRGEAPTELSTRKRAQLEGFAADATEMERQQLSEFEEAEEAAAIVQALRIGHAADLQFWQQAHKYAHPAEHPIISELVAAKTAYYSSMADFLDRYPAT